MRHKGNNMSTEDLERLGLVEDKDGNWGAPKKNPLSSFVLPNKNSKERYLPQIVTVDDPPMFYKIKKNKYYLTAQVFYAGIHWSTRKKIVDKAKSFLKRQTKSLVPLHPKSTLTVIISSKRTITETMNYDIDNRGYFWGKIFQDALEDRKLVKNDNVYWITEVRYRFNHDLKEERLIFEIT